VTAWRIPTVAAVDTPHGAWCRKSGESWLPADPVEGPGGVSAGPYTRLGYTPAGQPMRIQVEGHVMMAAGDGQLGRSVELEGGRIVE
jgi:hypothetical protein